MDLACDKNFEIFYELTEKNSLDNLHLFPTIKKSEEKSFLFQQFWKKMSPKKIIFWISLSIFLLLPEMN